MTGHPAHSLKPRKKPIQKRSQETWKIVLEAAAQVFAKHGYSGTSTNLIAERAGLSIGTIYEYFPNKDVLLSELQSHWSDICWEYLQSLPAQDPNMALEERVRSMFETWVSVFQINPALYAALVHDLPTRANKWKADARLSERIQITAKELGQYTSRLRITNVPLSCEILIRGIQAYLDGLIVAEPDRLNSVELIDELTDQFCELVLKPTNL